MTTVIEQVLENLADVPAAERLASAIADIARQFPDRAAVITSAGSDQRRIIDYRSLAAAVAKLERELDETRPAGIVARATRAESLVVIAAACGRQRVPLAFMTGAGNDLAGPLVDWLTVNDTLALPAVGPEHRPHEFESVPPPVIVATSGTSGPPKLVDHAWESVLAAARLSAWRISISSSATSSCLRGRLSRRRRPLVGRTRRGPSPSMGTPRGTSTP